MLAKFRSPRSRPIGDEQGSMALSLAAGARAAFAANDASKAALGVADKVGCVGAAAVDNISEDNVQFPA